MPAINFLKALFQPADRYQQIWPIKIYVLKLFFLLMFLFAAKDAWSVLITHRGEWNPEVAIAWCSIAAYTTLAGLGVIHTLKMLPIMLFMFLYKGLWLGFVAYPLWMQGQLAQSEAAEWTPIFILIVVPMIFTPWGYVFRSYVLGRD